MRGTAKRATPVLAAVTVLLAATSAYATAGKESPPSSGASKGSSGLNRSSNSKVLGSSQLWATVDVCKTGDMPMIGVRGSMPTDGDAHDMMYMRFGVQYLDSKTGKWAYLPKGAETSFTKVGYANATRQAGRNFHLGSPSQGQRFQLRGLIEFQWRHGSKVVLSAVRPTTSGHKKTVLHAEPNGYSAASCELG